MRFVPTERKNYDVSSVNWAVVLQSILHSGKLQCFTKEVGIVSHTNVVTEWDTRSEVSPKKYVLVPTFTESLKKDGTIF